MKIWKMKFETSIIILNVILTCIGHSFGQFGSGNPVRAKRSDDKPDTDFPLPEYLKNCNRTYLLSSQSWKMLSPFYGREQYPPGIKCSWNFIGDEQCTPEITCRELHLRKLDSDCSSEYFKVKDGVGGEERHCGRVEWDKFLRASEGAKDLFVEFVASSESRFETPTAGFFCEARCAAPTRFKEDIEHLRIESKRWKEDGRCICGFQNNDDRIVGGEDAKRNEFPWMAAIVKTGTRIPLCSGSLINDRFVITAAYCLKRLNLQPKDVQVLLHANILDQSLIKTAADVPLGEKGSIRSSGYKAGKISDSDENTKRFNVLEFDHHPLFNMKKYTYDISLVRLANKISVADANAPIPVCIPTPTNFNATFDNEMATVAGWGFSAENAGGTTRTLQKVELTVIPRAKCQSTMPTEIGETLLCAGNENGGKGICTGDAGSPLTTKQSSKRWLQIGLASWSVEGCGRANRPGLFTKLTDVAQWIFYRTSLENAAWCKAQ